MDKDLIGSRFWETKSMADMSKDEWEALCDGCGKCCLIKLEDVDTGDIHTTNIACHLLDCQTSRCKDYTNRKTIVSDCITLTHDKIAAMPWLPRSCAYRLLHEGQSLPDWHPLITGDPQSTQKAGRSIAKKVFSEGTIAEDDYPSHIKEWP